MYLTYLPFPNKHCLKYYYLQVLTNPQQLLHHSHLIHLSSIPYHKSYSQSNRSQTPPDTIALYLTSQYIYLTYLFPSNTVWNNRFHKCLPVPKNYYIPRIVYIYLVFRLTNPFFSQHTTTTSLYTYIHIYIYIYIYPNIYTSQ